MKKLTFLITLLAVSMLSVNVFAGERTVTEAYSDNVRRGDGKIVIATTDRGIDVSSNVVEDESKVNVFGLAPSGVQLTATDIWDRSNAAATQQIYIKPTVARVHQLVSSSTDDDGDSPGIGARTVRVNYLKDWDTPEMSIVVVMDGTTNVALPSLVFINKMEVVTMGALANNVGAITATADTDTTVSAVILASQGVTKSAIFGWSSIDTLYIKDWYGSIHGTDTANMSLELLANLIPDDMGSNTAYLHINKRGLNSTGTSSAAWPFDPPVKIEGPAIVKIQATASLADIEGGAGINGILKTDTSGFTVLVASKTYNVLTTSDGRVLMTTQ